MQTESGPLLTMEDSRMSVFSGAIALCEDSRLSTCAPLMPEELAEWRGVNNSSSSLSDLIPSSRDASRDASRITIGSRGPLFPGGDSCSASRLCADQALSCTPFEVEMPPEDKARENPPAVQAQWMHADSSNSSADGACASASREGSVVGPPPPAATKGAPKSRPSSSGAAKGGKERSKAAKTANTGPDGDGEGEKMSGMWTGEENRTFFDALSRHGRSFPKIHSQLQSTKTKEQVRCYYYRVIKKINQIIAPSGKKLVKTTGGASEGAGVIEAILSWWNTFRTDSEEDTSANLFKKCANLTEEGRRTFVDSMQRGGVSTAFAVKTAEIGPSTAAAAAAAAAHQAQVNDNGTTNCAQAKNSVATPPEAKEHVVGSLSSLSPQQVASGAAINAMVGKSSCAEETLPAAVDGSLSIGDALATVSSSSSSASSSPSSPPSSATLQETAGVQETGAVRQPASDLSQSCLGHVASCSSSQQATLKCSKAQRQAPALAQKRQHGISEVTGSVAGVGVAPLCEKKDVVAARDTAMSTLSKQKQTPLKHERISVAAESPPDAHAYNSSSPGAAGNSSSVFSAGDGTPRLKLKLLASHPALAQLIERCGFNAQLQLTFKPGGKSMGSICSHLALKWGKAANERLLHLMPSKMQFQTAPTFLLHSHSCHNPVGLLPSSNKPLLQRSNTPAGGYTWGPSDRDVQASDVYADFGQPKTFQLSYGLQGFDIPALDALALRLARTQLLAGRHGAGSVTSSVEQGGARWYESSGHDTERGQSVARAKSAAFGQHGQVAALQGATPPVAAHSRSTDCSTRGSQAPCGMMQAMPARARDGSTVRCTSPVPSTVVNPVDFVPFMHHRSASNESKDESKDGQEDDRRRGNNDLSRDPLDFSDIVQDTQDARTHPSSSTPAPASGKLGVFPPAGMDLKSSVSQSLFSPPRDPSNAFGTCTRDSYVLFSPARECRAGMPHDSCCLSYSGFSAVASGCASKIERSDADGADFLPVEGLLGHAAANSRDVPILAPADTNDGFGGGETRDASVMLINDNSLHLTLDSNHARSGVPNHEAGAHVHAHDVHEALTDASSCQLERLLPHHACESSLLGLNSRDSFGLLKRGREENTEEHAWQRNVKRDSF